MEIDTVTRVPEDRRREEGTFLAATVFGIPVRVHGIFSILILVFGGIAAAGGNGETALLIPAVLLINAVHEMGHALMARRLGHAIRSIVLHPFRCLATFSRPLNPRHELFIALAGPAANLCTAALGWGAIALFARFYLGESDGNTMLGLLQNSPVGRFVFLNGLVALVNLLPVFPMDGGLALRGFLEGAGSTRESATRSVVILSYLTAALFVAVGVQQGSTFTILFAAFLTMGTTHRMSSDTFFSAISRLTVRDVMQPGDLRTLLLAQTLDSVAENKMPPTQHFFPVLCGDEVFGTISRFALEAGLRNGKGGTYVAESMDRRLVFAGPDEPLKIVLERGRLSPGAPILVGEPGNLLGMVTLESIQQRLSSPLPAAGTIN